MPIPGEDDNVSENFGSYKDDKLEKQDIEGDHRNLVGENLNTGSYVRDSLSECLFQDAILASELSVSSRKFRLNKQEFPIGKFVLDIKYFYLGLQNNNSFHPFND